MRKFFYEQVNRIQDKSIQKFIYAALDDAPYQFFIAPSSSSGKYHPLENQGRSGLLRHSIKCAEVSLELANFYNLELIDKDIVFAASLIHDIQKNGMPWGFNTDYTHGKIAYDWLGKFSNLSKHSFEVRQCIKYHMGRWIQPKEELERALQPTPRELVVQLSDYVSSRKTISYLPNNEVSYRRIRGYGSSNK